MVTVSHVIQKLINDRVFIQEALNQSIVSYGSLAKKLAPEVEQELGKPVKIHAVVMALRRYSQKLQDLHKNVYFDYTSEIILKTDICDISIIGSPTFFAKLKKLHDMVKLEEGDLLNIIHGRKEVSIVTNERHRERFLNFLKEEKVINVEKNLVALTLTYPRDFFYTPGVIFNIVRNIAWESINIFEIVSTNTELTFIVSKNDAIKGYKALEKLVVKI